MANTRNPRNTPADPTPAVPEGSDEAAPAKVALPSLAALTAAPEGALSRKAANAPNPLDGAVATSIEQKQALTLPAANETQARQIMNLLVREQKAHGWGLSKKAVPNKDNDGNPDGTFSVVFQGHLEKRTYTQS